MSNSGFIKGLGVGFLYLNGFLSPVMSQTPSAPVNSNNMESVNTPSKVIEYGTQNSLYSVLFSQEISQSIPRNAPLSNALLQEANARLLQRLTGRSTYAQTDEGKTFIAAKKKWLRSFDWLPIRAEGVLVGEQLRLNFDKTLVSQFLEEANIEVWPKIVRPKVLIMGTYVQGGDLMKMTVFPEPSRQIQKLISDARQLGLAVAFPSRAQRWVYPIKPQPNTENLQERLIASQHDYLLSYQVTAKPTGTQTQTYELNWSLYNTSGQLVKDGRLFDANQMQLIGEMLPRVTEHLATITQLTLQQETQLFLNLLQVTDAEQVFFAKEQLQNDFPVITSLHLLELEGELAQFDLSFNGRYHDFLGWLHQNATFTVLNESDVLRQIDVVYSIPVEVDLEDLQQQMMPSDQKRPLKGVEEDLQGDSTTFLDKSVEQQSIEITQ